MLCPGAGGTVGTTLSLREKETGGRPAALDPRAAIPTKLVSAFMAEGS